MEVGSLADWVSGISTAGTLVTGLVLIAQDRRERLVDRAENLYATLEREDPTDRAAFQGLCMIVTNSGPETFRKVMAYRVAEIEASSGERHMIRLTFHLPLVQPASKYTWSVAKDCRVPPDQYAHPLSLLTYDFRGRHWVRWPGRFPENLSARQRVKIRWRSRPYASLHETRFSIDDATRTALDSNPR